MKTETIARVRRPGKTSKVRASAPQWSYLALAAIVLFFSLVRFRLIDMPLERDEGEYAYAGQLILQGVPPYLSVYNMKLPGTYAAYALIMLLFGQTPAAIHGGLIVVTAVTIILIYFLAARLFGASGGVIAAASYGLLSSVPTILGFAGHSTHFVVLPAVAGTLALLYAVENKQMSWFFTSGLLMGVAFVMKQPGIFFVLFAAGYLLYREWRRPVDWRGLGTKLAALTAGAALPVLITCFILWRAGVFHSFWFWTFTYARQYGSIVSLLDASGLFWDTLPAVTGSAVWVWLIAAAGFTAFLWNARARSHMVFLTSFFLFSVLAVCTGFYFRSHYFILLLPAVSLLVAAGVTAGREQLAGKNWILQQAPLLVFLVAFSWCIARESDFLFEMNAEQATRSLYFANPFPEAQKIGDYVAHNCAPTDRIAVLGSEPEIYFYAKRRSATGFIYTYPLMEDQRFAAKMQSQMISEIEAAKPAFLIFVDVPFSWLRRPDSEPLIFDWFEKYRQSNYEPAGIADILQETQYRWGDEAKTYQPASPFTVRVFRRAQP